MKKTLRQSATMLSIPVLFFTIFLQSAPKDITEEFFKGKSHPGIYAFSRKYTVYGGKPAESIVLENAGRKIGFIDIYGSTADVTQPSFNTIIQININQSHRNQGLGSALLTYALDKCTGNCVETILVAMSPSAKQEDRLKLEAFYTKNGGVRDKSNQGANGKFAFKS